MRRAKRTATEPPRRAPTKPARAFTVATVRVSGTVDHDPDPAFRALLHAALRAILKAR